MKGRGRAGGFTLLELLLVVLMMGVMSLWVIPRLGSFGATDIKWTARHLATLIRQVAEETTATKRLHRLYYNLSEARYRVKVLEENGEYVDGPPAGQALPTGVIFEDVVTGRVGKVTEGETYTQFYPFGVEKSWIHLRSGKQQWSLEVQPLTGGVKVYDRYVDGATQ